MKLLMAHRGPPGEAEAEPIILEVADSRAILRMDDGNQVAMDRADLREALRVETILMREGIGSESA